MGSQVKYICMGVISLGIFGYYFNLYSKEVQHNRQEKQKFNRVYQNSQQDRYKPFQQIMKDQNKKEIRQKLICINAIKPEYNQNTFKLYERQRSIYFEVLKKNKSVLQHQMGGHFMFKFKNNLIKCELNDVNISKNLIQDIKKEPVHLFKGINKVEPIVQSVVSSLTASVLSVYGKLYYDDKKLQWTIEPFFLGFYLSLKSEVQKYYDDKTHQGSIVKLAIFVCSCVVGYFALLKPGISLFQKYMRRKSDEKIMGISDFEYFKNKDYLLVKEESLLNCESCKQKSVEIVYECGHLAICSDCHIKNINKQCLLCKIKSNRFMKIFMS